MSKATEFALHGAFFADGLHEVGYARCLAVMETNGQGYVEMLSGLAEYAEYLEMLIAAAESVDDSHYPGVLHYEVSSPFGKWYGEQLIATGDVPDTSMCKMWLKNEVIKFFTQGLGVDEAKQYELAFSHSTPEESQQATTTT